MNNEPENSLTISSLRKLTRLVWILVVLLILNLLATIILGLSPSLFVQRLNNQLSNHAFPPSEDPMNDFHAWPFEKQVQASSLIIRTEYEKSDQRIKCIIKEIIKQNPGTKFYYKIGDEYTDLGRLPEKDTSYGDGQIAFFVGSPAEMRVAVPYSKGRLTSKGGMSLDDLRQLSKGAKPDRS